MFPLDTELEMRAGLHSGAVTGMLHLLGKHVPRCWTYHNTNASRMLYFHLTQPVYCAGSDLVFSCLEVRVLHCVVGALNREHLS